MLEIICRQVPVALPVFSLYSYVLLHASRKTFSNVKVSISAQWTPSFQNVSLSPGEVLSTSRAEQHATQYSTMFVLHVAADAVQ